MSLEELARVVPPPDKPIEAGNLQEWKMVEWRLQLPSDILNIQLPRDFFDLAHAYGTGFFIVEKSKNTGNAIKIWNPFSDEYCPWLLHMCRIYRRSKEMVKSPEFPLGIYPDSVGLLPIGDDANGGMLFWHTDGKPADWPIVANPPGYRIFERFHLSLTSFLAKCFTGEISCVLWGEETFARNPRIFFKSTKSLNPRK